jgi:hypothetical protein
MIDWFKKKNLVKYYEFKILWFQPIDISENIIKTRQNMPDDTAVRKANTCTAKDFENAHLRPDFVIKRIPPEDYLIYPYDKPQERYSVATLLHLLNINQK